MDAEPLLEFRREFARDFPKAELYLVGGAVRDAMLGRPNKDFDFIVTGVPKEEIENWFGTRGHIELTGRNFGVWKFTPRGFQTNQIEPVDLALPRREHISPDSMGGYRDFEMQSDPNLPIGKDLERRDFTMNALAYDDKKGEILDLFGGAQDIEHKLIRAVNDPRERFGEDLSRMLRAIRFATQLGFEIEAGTFAAIKEKMPLINQTRERRLTDVERARGKKGGDEFVVPRETVGKEIAKALVADPAKTLDLLRASGALRELLPEIDELSQDDEYLQPLAAMRTRDATVIAALMLRGLDAQQARAQVRAVGISLLPAESPYRVREDEAGWIVARLHEGEPNVEVMRASVFERQYMNERGERYLAALDALGHTAAAKSIRDRIADIRERWLAEDDEKIKPLVSGNDVLELGIKAGPRVRELLDAARDAQLDGQTMNRESALGLLKSLVTE